MTEPKKPRGFGTYTPEQRREYARLGGLAASRDRKFMAEIGKKGGKALVEKYGSDHMTELGIKAAQKRFPRRGVNKQKGKI